MGRAGMIARAVYTHDVSPIGYASVVCQAIGLAITAYGLSMTWRAFKTSDERFAEPVVRAVRRLTPFRKRDVVVQAGFAEVVAVAIDARVEVTFGPLPTDDREAIELLGARVQGLRTNLEGTANGIRDEIRDVESRVRAIEGAVSDSVARLEDADRRVATDGIRVESVGLGVVAVGLILQVLA